MHWLLRLHFKPHHLARLTLETGTISTVISNNSFGNCFPLWDTNVRFLILDNRDRFFILDSSVRILFWTPVSHFWLKKLEHQCLIFDFLTIVSNSWIWTLGYYFWFLTPVFKFRFFFFESDFLTLDTSVWYLILDISFRF